MKIYDFLIACEYPDVQAISIFFGEVRIFDGNVQDVTLGVIKKYGNLKITSWNTEKATSAIYIKVE